MIMTPVEFRSDRIKIFIFSDPQLWISTLLMTHSSLVSCILCRPRNKGVLEKLQFILEMICNLTNFINERNDFKIVKAFFKFMTKEFFSDDLSLI